MENFKKIRNKLLTGIMGVGLGLAAHAEKPAENPIKEKEQNKMEMTHQESENTSSEVVLPGMEPDPVDFAEAEREMKIEKIQKELGQWEQELKTSTDTLNHAVEDFETSYTEVLLSMGEDAPKRPVIDDEKAEAEFQQHINDLLKKIKKPGYKVKSSDLFYTPEVLKRLVSEMSGKYVTTQDITSKRSVESLKGILLGQGSPLESQVAYLNQLMNQSLNSSGGFTSLGDKAVETFDGTSPVIVDYQPNRHDQAHATPGSVSENLKQRAALGAALGEIIEQVLHAEKAEHNIDELKAQMDLLMNAPDAPSELASQ